MNKKQVLFNLIKQISRSLQFNQNIFKMKKIFFKISFYSVSKLLFELKFSNINNMELMKNLINQNVGSQCFVYPGCLYVLAHNLRNKCHWNRGLQTKAKIIMNATKSATKLNLNHSLGKHDSLENLPMLTKKKFKRK